MTAPDDASRPAPHGHAGAPSRRGTSAAVVLLLYVLPLGLTAAFLASVGLGLLAVALLAVEATVVAAIALARRRPRSPARPTSGRTVLLALGGLVALVVTALVVLRPAAG